MSLSVTIRHSVFWPSDLAFCLAVSSINNDINRLSCKAEANTSSEMGAIELQSKK